jgi:mannan endo-1,4-beta-mannosidase
VMADLAKAADGLDMLRKAGVPVLWRPLHEANLRYFWWSSGGPDAYRGLWAMMYTYFVKDRGLNNLIWVWNGQSRDWLVPSEEFDIASMDIYPRTGINRSSQVDRFLQCQGLAPNKMVALSECEFIPEPGNLIRDGAGWLWYMSWQATYLYVSNGDDAHPLPARPFQLNAHYINDADLKRIMSNPYVINLDRLR